MLERAERDQSAPVALSRKHSYGKHLRIPLLGQGITSRVCSMLSSVLLHVDFDPRDLRSLLRARKFVLVRRSDRLTMKASLKQRIYAANQLHLTRRGR